MTQRGWLRRNVWGLVVLGPLLVAVFAVNGCVAYDRNYRAQPKEPVPVDGTGLATLDSFGVRLMELAPVENPLEIDDMISSIGSPIPPSVTVWRAILTVTAPAESYVGQCQLWLEDASGSRHLSGPAELPGAPGGLGAACYPDDRDQPAPYTATGVFLLPAEARPTAVLVVWRPLLPRFIRFPVVP